MRKSGSWDWQGISYRNLPRILFRLSLYQIFFTISNCQKSFSFPLSPHTYTCTHTHMHTHSSLPPCHTTFSALPPSSLAVTSVASDPHCLPKPPGKHTLASFSDSSSSVGSRRLEFGWTHSFSASLLTKPWWPPLPRPVSCTFTYLLSFLQILQLNTKESFFFLIDLYWSIIASQYCVSFCCTTKRISHMHTHVPISPPSCVSLPPSLSHPSRSSQSTEPISLCYTAASHQPTILHTVVYICRCYCHFTLALPSHPMSSSPFSMSSVGYYF